MCRRPDRKSTRLNSSHGYISYAVFCLKKKKNNNVRMRLLCSSRRTRVRQDAYPRILAVRAHRMLARSTILCCTRRPSLCLFFNDTATTEIYTLSLHDALPISPPVAAHGVLRLQGRAGDDGQGAGNRDRKSTRLNSSHGYISYALFCLRKKTMPASSPPLTHILSPLPTTTSRASR